MKKTLIALAALAAVGTASAQSTVTLSGIFKAGVAQTKYSGGTGLATGSSLAVTDGASRFIISGSEDLGGGMRANFQVDNRFRLDDNGGTRFDGLTAATIVNANPLGGGATFVGLSGGFGALQVGKLDTHYCLGGDTHGSRSTSLQAGSCGLLGYVQGQANSIANVGRSTNVIRYTTPSFGGFNGQLNYSTSPFGSEGPVGDAGKGKAVAAALNYTAGPLRAGLSVWNAETENRAAAGDQKAATAMVDWNFGVGSVGLTFDRSERGTLERDAWSVPMTFRLGTGTLLATYTRANNAENAGVNVPNSGANLISVGYDYPLSRRTSLGVSYARLDNKAAASYQLFASALMGTPASGLGQDANQFYVGVRHAF
jgi:predicted porin